MADISADISLQYHTCHQCGRTYKCREYLQLHLNGCKQAKLVTGEKQYEYHYMGEQADQWAPDGMCDIPLEEEEELLEFKLRLVLEHFQTVNHNRNVTCNSVSKNIRDPSCNYISNNDAKIANKKQNLETETMVKNRFYKQVFTYQTSEESNTTKLLRDPLHCTSHDTQQEPQILNNLNTSDVSQNLKTLPSRELTRLESLPMSEAATLLESQCIDDVTHFTSKESETTVPITVVAPKEAIGTPHSCPVCKRTFLHKGNFNSHSCIQPGAKSYGCVNCDARFPSKHGLKIHTAKKHPRIAQTQATEFNYRSCSQDGSREEVTQIEVKNATSRCDSPISEEMLHFQSLDALYSDADGSSTFAPNDNPSAKAMYLSEQDIDRKTIRCPICQRTFRDKRDQSSHTCIQPGGKSYDCNLCDSRFSNKTGLSIHLSKRHGKSIPRLVHGVGADIPSSNTTSKSKQVVKAGRISCQICRRTFRDKHDLPSHSCIQLGAKSHDCTVCGSRFVSETGLTSHLLKRHRRSILHTHLKKLQSKISTFNRKNTLKRHQSVHTDHKKFTCNICKGQFKRKESLMKHRSFHD